MSLRNVFQRRNARDRAWFAVKTKSKKFSTVINRSRHFVRILSLTFIRWHCTPSSDYSSFIHSFVRLFVHSFVQSLVNSFVRSFIRSLHHRPMQSLMWTQLSSAIDVCNKQREGKDFWHNSFSATMGWWSNVPFGREEAYWMASVCPAHSLEPSALCPLRRRARTRTKSED